MVVKEAYRSLMTHWICGSAGRKEETNIFWCSNVTYDICLKDR